MRPILDIIAEATTDAGYQSPASVFGSGDKLARLCVVQANRTVDDLVRAGDGRSWSALMSTWQFDLDTTTAAYPLPPDYETMVPDTMYRENMPAYSMAQVSDQSWAYIKASNIIPSIPFYYRVIGGEIVFPKAPASAEKVFIEYVSGFPVTSTQGKGWDNARWGTDVFGDSGPPVVSRHQHFIKDDDTFRLDDRLLSLGLTWRLLRARGEAYADQRMEYADAVGDAFSRDYGGLQSMGFGPECCGHDTRYHADPTGRNTVILG